MIPRKSGFANIPIHLSGIYLTGAGLCGSGVFSKFFQPSTFSSLSELFSHFQRTLSHVFFFCSKSEVHVLYKYRQNILTMKLKPFWVNVGPL